MVVDSKFPQRVLSPFALSRTTECVRSLKVIRRRPVSVVVPSSEYDLSHPEYRSHDESWRLQTPEDWTLDGAESDHWREYEL
jgi:hypothetical protein